MNALTRLFTFGAADADRRVAAFLQPRDHSGAERYLLSSVSLGAFDRATQRLAAWWLDAEAGRAAIVLAGAWSRESQSSRNRRLGIVFLVAVAVHVTLMLWQGPPPGWFWLLIPALAASVAVLLLLAARSADTTT
jgi:hypothetical protein